MSSTRFPPIGKLVDVGGYRLHIHSMGEGSPAVVFEAGGASWSLDWHLVQTKIARITTTCSYDRAGFGWSESGPKPRTSQQIVTELHTLLTQAGVEKPYILVGASFGGHTARLYAHQYPQDVAGIILLDARHEALNARMPVSWQKLETTGKQMYRVMLLASRLNLLKALGKLAGEKGLPPILKRLPPELQRVYLEVGFQPKYFASNLDELAACAESDQQLRLSGSFEDLPLVVIRHGIPDLFKQMSPEDAQKAEQVWQELQAELSRLSSSGEMCVAEKSGHGIQIEQPEVVVDAIQRMVEQVRWK